MKKIFGFLQPYKLAIVVAYSLTFIELVAELLLPFFLGKMINDGIIAQDINNIMMWGSIMIGLTFLAFTCGIINSFYSSHVSLGFAYDLREKLFHKIQSFAFSHLNEYPTSALITRFTNDVRQIQNTIFMALRVMIKAPFLVIGGVLMAFIINAKLAFIFVITVPLLIGFLAWVLKKASSMFSLVQKRVDHVNRIIQENLSGIWLIKAFFRRKHEENRFQQANEALASTTRTAFRFVESSMPILLWIMNISLIIIIWFGNMQAVAGETSVGDVVAIVNYALRVSMAISMFTFITLAFSRAKASAERIHDVLTVKTNDGLESTIHHPTTQITKGKIAFQSVSFTYPSASERVLKDITFTIQPMEKVAIMGATGAGKTSLFQLIPRLYDVQSGIIYIDNRPITDYASSHLRQSIGYVPQSPLLFSGTIKDNIMWGKENATDAEMIEAAKAAQIHETIVQLSAQYNTKIGQRGVNLSGGQKQRISIARALIRNPKILMLDDSTSALDLATESLLLEAIENMHCTTLLITQKISTAMKSDRIMLMDHGEIIALGTHADLLEQSDLYKQIYDSQDGKEPVYVHQTT